MALIGWKELREQAELGNPEAIQAIATSLEDLATRTVSADGGIDLENAEWAIDNPDAKGHLHELQEQREADREKIEKLQSQIYQSGREYVALVESITDRLREAVNGEGLDLDLAKTIAADLGAEEPVNLYEVKVYVEITVSNVAADDEDTAEQMVRDNIQIDDVSADGKDVETSWEVQSTDVSEQ